MSALKILRVPEVVEKTGLGKEVIYKMYSNNDFPRKIRMGRAIGFIEDEVDAWLLSKQEPQVIDRVKGD